MKNNVIERSDLLLAFFFAPILSDADNFNVPVKGRTKLEKAFFIFEKEIKKEFLKDNDVNAQFYEFLPYNYGPYSDKIIEDLNIFISIGFITESETDIPIPDASRIENQNAEDDAYSVEKCNNEQFEMSYTLTDIGENYTKDRVWDNLTSNQKNALIELKTKVTELSLDTILRYVYNKYPEMTSKSKIAEKYLK